MSLETIIKEMKTLKPLAEEDPNSGPPETMVGRRGRIAQAAERLTELKRSYAESLLQSAVFIIVAGAKRNEFSDIATGEKFNLFSSDPETFYADLANRIPPVLYANHNASPSNLFDILGRHLEDKMREIGVEQYNQLIFREKYITKMNNATEFAQVVKASINEQIGAEIVGIQAAASIVDKALSVNHQAKTTPIVLNTSDEKLALQLSSDLGRITQRVFLVNAGKSSKELRAVEESISLKEVTEDSVKSTLDQIKNSMRR
jgi:hypothetical protein